MTWKWYYAYWYEKKIIYHKTDLTKNKLLSRSKVGKTDGSNDNMA